MSDSLPKHMFVSHESKKNVLRQSFQVCKNKMLWKNLEVPLVCLGALDYTLQVLLREI